MNAGDHAKPRAPHSLRRLFSLIMMAVWVCALAFGLRTFVFLPYVIPSSSMEDTIMIGDMVFSEKVTYQFGSPQPGDIVTFVDQSDASRVLIKRCIATEGQTVEIDESGVMKIDGVVQSESYTGATQTYPLTSNITYPYTVPSGHIWVMGDNRTNSQDSRYFGAIPVSSVTGRACMTYWPLDRIGILS